MTLHRRTLLGSTAALLAAPAYAPALAQTGPIKIGVMAPLTGVLAAGGREMVDGVTMFVEQAGKKMAGRDVELVVEDDGSNPDTSLQKARRLVEQAKVDFMMGNLLANTGLAVAGYVRGTGTPYFIPIIAADELTQRGRIPNVVRVAGYSASQMAHPLGDWAWKKGYKKIATIGQDYTFGHEQCAGFARVFSNAGGQVVRQFWHPLNTSDFSPYLGQLASLGVDAIFAMETGADATRFIQQYASFGLKQRIPLLGAMNATDQSVIRTLGAECEGIVSSAHFAEGSDVPATKAFVEEHVKRFNRIPSLYGFAMYSCTMWVAKALEKIGGRAEDRAALLAAVRETELDNSPLGRPVKLDEFGNPVYDVYIRQTVKRADGKYWNVPLETYPRVSQFWRYSPEEYMRQSPYSRENQYIRQG